MDSRNRDGENRNQDSKSLGGALVDVFDAAVSLVKSELTALARRAGDLVKAKGLGAVLLLAAAAPLSLALIFLILFVFFGLERLGLGAWAASLLIAIVSLIVTAGLILFGIRKLTEEVPEGGRPLSEVEKDDLKYGGKETDTPGSGTQVVPGVYRADTTASKGEERGRSVPSTNPSSPTPGAQVSTNSHGSTSPIAKKTVQGQGPLDGDSALTHSTANPVYTPGAPSVRTTTVVTPGAATPAAASSTATTPAPATSAAVAPSTQARSTTAPGAQLSDRQADAQGLHKGTQSTNTGNAGETGKNAPAGHGSPAKPDQGISVSTTPTYRDDMKKEGY